MSYQSTFKRYEIKYMLTLQQKESALTAMEPYMKLDSYGHSLIRNVYFDTDSYRLIRHSLEKPVYKEKLRTRSYGSPKPGSPVFVELKKKYDDVVYKRRLSLPEKEVSDWLEGSQVPAVHTQIEEEIDYFRQYYAPLTPKVFLSYEREAYYSLDGSDFRVTFDDAIMARQDRLSLSSEVGGTPLLPPGMVLMEIKTPGSLPLWMTHFLTEQKLYKTSFSKYGTAYQMMLAHNRQAESA